MSLREFKCKFCGCVSLAFEDESQRLDPNYSCGGPFPHEWNVLPPRVSVVLATNAFMLESPQLDSIPSIYELDRQLNIETREEKETLIFQDIRRNL